MALTSKKTTRLALDSNKAACLALNSKKAACVVKNGIVIFSVFCYRFARKHPIISSVLLWFGLLYVVSPRLFFFLVSSSPVLISTALLLGTLLSLGQPHIPQIDDLDEEEDDVQVSSEAHEDEDEKKKDEIEEATDDDFSELENRKDDSDSVVPEVSVTRVSKRRFEEGIDDFSTRRYIDAENLLGRRAEVVETIEEEEEQYNVEDLDDGKDQIKGDIDSRSVDFMPSQKKGEQEVTEIEDKGPAAAVYKSINILERSVEKEAENMDYGEEISERTEEKEALEDLEGQEIQSDDEKEEAPMLNRIKSVHFSDRDTVIEGTSQMPLKEIEVEEEMPLLGHPSSSSLEFHEEVSGSRIVEVDSSKGISKSKGLDGGVDKAHAEVQVSDKEEENAPSASLEDFFSLSFQPSWKRIGHHRSSSGSSSDAAESSSPDASLGDLGPMFDELHPLLDFERSKTYSVSDSDIGETSGINKEEFSPRETAPQDLMEFADEHEAPSHVHEEEEEEEEEEDDSHADFGFTWTEDDEKNLRDLGLSEKERMQLEERVIARRHVQHPQGAQEESLIDFYVEERASFIDEENLLEIGFSGEALAKESPEIQTGSVDHTLESQCESDSKDIPSEVHLDSTSRDIHLEKVHSDAGHEDTPKVHIDEVSKENPIELVAKSSTSHINELPQTDLLPQEGNNYFEVSSSEEIESAPRNVIEEGTEYVHEEIKVDSPKDSAHSIDTVDVVSLDSPVEFDMQIKSIDTAAEVSSIQEEQSKSEENLETNYDSSSSSSDDIVSMSTEGTTEEPTTKDDEMEATSPKDYENLTDNAEATELGSPPDSEMQRESVPTIEEVGSTEEHQLKGEKSEEPSYDSSSSTSEEIESMTEEVAAIDRDAHPTVEMTRDNVPTVAEVATEKHQEKIEETSDDSRSSTSEEIESEIIAGELSSKHEAVQVESPTEQLAEKGEVVELDSGLEMEIKGETALTEEQESKEEKIEKHFDDPSVLTSEETETVCRDFMEEDLARKQVDSPEAYQESAEMGEVVERNSQPVVEIHRDSLPTVEEVAASETEESKLVEKEEPSNISASQNQEGLIMLEVKSKEETESAIEDVSAEELGDKQEEACISENEDRLTMLEDKSIEETESAIEDVNTKELGSKLEEESLSENQEGPIMLEDKSKEEIESAIEDVITDHLGNKQQEAGTENQDELTMLEVKSIEEIESAIEDVIAKELSSKQEEASISENQDGLTILEVKSIEEIESAIEDVIVKELSSKHDEASTSENQDGLTMLEVKSIEEIEAAIENVVLKESGRQGVAEGSSTEKEHLMQKETGQTSDDSSSSASDISSPKRLEEPTILDVEPKEEIEAAINEDIAEKFTKHEEIKVGPSQAYEQSTENVESIKLDSPPLMDMHRDIPPVVAEGASREENESESEKTEHSSSALSSTIMEVRENPSSDGREIQ